MRVVGVIAAGIVVVGCSTGSVVGPVSAQARTDSVVVLSPREIRKLVVGKTLTFDIVAEDYGHDERFERDGVWVATDSSPPIFGKYSVDNRGICVVISKTTETCRQVIFDSGKYYVQWVKPPGPRRIAITRIQ